MRKRLNWLRIAWLCVVLTVVIFRGGWGMAQIYILKKKHYDTSLDIQSCRAVPVVRKPALVKFKTQLEEAQQHATSVKATFGSQGNDFFAVSGSNGAWRSWNVR